MVHFFTEGLPSYEDASEYVLPAVSSINPSCVYAPETPFGTYLQVATYKFESVFS